MSGKRKRQKKATTTSQTSKKAKPGRSYFVLIEFSIIQLCPGGGSSVTAPDPPSIPKQGACTRCRHRKVKCEYEGNSTICRKCVSAGLEDSCMQEVAVPPKVSERPKKAASGHRRSSQRAESTRRDQGSQSDARSEHSNFQIVICVGH